MLPVNAEMITVIAGLAACLPAVVIRNRAHEFNLVQFAGISQLFDRQVVLINEMFSREVALSSEMFMHNRVNGVIRFGTGAGLDVEDDRAVIAPTFEHPIIDHDNP